MLEVEKNIRELKSKISELQKMAEEKQIDFSDEIKKLEAKLQELEAEAYGSITPMDKFALSRMLERPTSLDYIEKIFDGFMEFHGDRYFGDDPCIVGGIAKLGDMPVTVIGQQRGRNMKENVKRNFGMPNPEGYRKALRLMKQAEKFKRPIICFIDTKGANPGIGPEERGQGEAIARNLMEMPLLKTPIISVVLGEGGSGGALAMSIADEIWMLEHAVYSVVSPEGFASILWKDSSPERIKEAVKLLKMTAQDLKEIDVVDRILPEPPGGAQNDPDAMITMVKEQLMQVPFRTMAQNIEQLLEKRYDKYRKIGKFLEE